MALPLLYRLDLFRSPNLPVNPERAEGSGLPLPDGWRQRFHCDATAPMLGPYAGISRFFLYRENRYVRPERGDTLHPSVQARMDALPSYQPRALRGNDGKAQPTSGMMQEL